MKIKTAEKSYQDVMAIPATPHKKPVKQTAFFRKLLKVVSNSELKATNFTYTEEGMEKLAKDEPALILMNHSSFTDLQIVSKLFADRQYHIVCTNDGFVGKDGLMRKIGCIPTEKFVMDIALVRDMKYCFDTLKSSVLMYPEASYSFDGTETPLPKSLGKCIKMMGVPVVMVRTTGAFLRDPLYNNLQKRKVDVSATVSYLLSPAEVKEKSADEINEILADAFRYDHFREQAASGVLITEDFRADGLHRALYKCPACGCEGQMEGKGIQIQCKACGDTHELTEEGRLKRVCEVDGDSHLQEKSFEFVSDWYAWERAKVREEILSESYRMEEDVEIYMLVDTSAVYHVGEGHLSHSNEGFVLDGCDGALHYEQPAKISYSLYADYFWYELGDMICIGDNKRQYYCFPKNQEAAIVAKARLATEELYQLKATK